MRPLEPMRPLELMRRLEPIGPLEQRLEPTLQLELQELHRFCCKQQLPERSGLQRGEIVSLLNSLTKICGEYIEPKFKSALIADPGF